MLCCGYTLTDFPISIRLTSLALWQFNDCPSASKATLMNMDKYFMWIHYERLHNHSKAKYNKTVYIFLDPILHIMLNLESNINNLCHKICWISFKYGKYICSRTANLLSTTRSDQRDNSIYRYNIQCSCMVNFKDATASLPTYRYTVNRLFWRDGLFQRAKQRLEYWYRIDIDPTWKCRIDV